MEQYWAKLKRKSLRVMTLDRMIAKTRGPVQLKRVVKLLPLTLLGLGAIIGAGVFVLTGEVAREHTGPSVILSYAFSALVALLCALCYAEFAADVPCSGAAYNYLALVYGEFISWIAANGLLLEYMLCVSAVAKGFSGYLCTLFGADSDSLILTFESADYIVIDIVGAVFVVFLTLILVYGVSESFVFNSFSTILVVGFVLFTICTAAPKVHSDNWSPFFPKEFGFSNTFHGSSIVFFAYIGFDATATVAEELENPARDIPIAIISSVCITTVLYLLMAGAIVGMVPYDEIDVRAPFSSAFKDLGWDWASRIVSIGALFGFVTTVFGYSYSSYRLLMVLGREGFLPSWLGEVHPKWQTPVNATIVGGTIGAVMALLLDISTLSSLVSVESLFCFCLICQACIWRRYRGMAHLPVPEGVEPVKWQWLFVRMFLLVVVSILEGLSIDKKWPWWAWLIIILIFLGICLSFLNLPVVFVPQRFSLPFMPLIPCLGVMFTIHLIVTLETPAFIRMVCWECFSVVLYLVYGVHRTKDIEEDQQEQEEEVESNTIPLIKESTT